MGMMQTAAAVPANMQAAVYRGVNYHEPVPPGKSTPLLLMPVSQLYCASAPSTQLFANW